jgi:hypothetical protein
MAYVKNKIHNVELDEFNHVKNTNPFSTQTPFIRIEQRYSAGNTGEVELYTFDENKPISEYVGIHDILAEAKDKPTFKIRVLGNGSESDAVLISLRGPTNIVNRGRYDYFVPVNFDGWKEIVLAEANNEDYEGYVFDGIDVGGTPYNPSYRARMHYDKLLTVQVSLCGKCEGVKLGKLSAYTPEDAVASSPTITVGSDTITFNTELHSSEYLEYYPEENKAYLNFYEHIFEGDKWIKDKFHVKEITFDGKITLPEGDFEYTFTEKPLTEFDTRAQVVFGVSGRVVSNPDGWTVPEIDMPDNIEKIKIY